jgi:hypothetical protein
MKTLISIVLILMLASPALAKESREDKQARLDSACEVERQKKLAPMRKKFVEDCVANKELPGYKDCETFYADYGNRMGGRAPLFFDLPECVTAFEFQQGARSGD